MGTQVTQTNQNNSQSTALYDFKKIFIGNNRYDRGTYANASGSTVTWNSGEFVARDSSNGNLVKVTSSNLDDVIGIVAIDGNDIQVPNNMSSNLTFCFKGDVNADYLTFPASVTLDTVVDNKLFRDVLHDLGIIFRDAVDNTRFDNN